MKHIKMVLYGEPGVGKSVFASKAPKPFFITTDGNYEFLEEFGAKPEDHVQVNSWNEFKKVISKLDLTNYETVVIDLTEDLFKWCEYEFCRVNGYEHVSDPGFAKGYDITRNDFFINISKILNLEDKNVILIMHGITSSTKDRRGIEHTKYYPTNRIPDKVMDMIEGRVRYFLRCYTKADEINGKLVKKRYLSLVPKENEYGILRGIDENSVPSDIALDFDEFAKIIGLESGIEKKEPKIKAKAEPKIEPTIVDIKVEKVEPVIEKQKSLPPLTTEPASELKFVAEPMPEPKPEQKPEQKAEVKEEPAQETQEKVESVEEKKARMLAEIKAKMLAMKDRK